MSNDRLALGRQIYDYFVGKGLAPHQAAAIAGNMAWEGGGRIDLVNPGDNIKNSPRSPHSVGVGQWNDRLPALVDYARKSGINLPDGDLRDAGYVRDVARQLPLNTQLDFAWNEMQGPERRAYEGITSGQDLRSATAGAIGYHRPAGWTRSNPYAGHGFDNRVAIADQILRASQAGGSSVPAPSGMSGSAFHAAAFPAPYALGGPKQAAEPVSTSSAAIPAQAKTPATEQPRAPAWDAAGFWDKQMLEGHADGGPVTLDEYRSAMPDDPLSAYRTQLKTGPNMVAPWDVPGTKSPVTGTLSNPAPRPGEYLAPAYEAVSPMVGGYGLAQGLGDVYNYAKEGDWKGVAESGIPLAAMAVMPGPKGKLPMDKAARMTRAAEQGFDTGTTWYHGAARADRIVDSGKFDPKRATSGPMAFFSDDPAMGSSYAMGKKADTSLMDEGHVPSYFTVSPKDLGHTSARTPYTVEQSWYHLKPEQKQEILARAKRVGYEDPSTATGDYTLHPPGVDASLSGDHFDYLMKTSARGNPLAALREMWHDGGELVGNEADLARIYQLAGYPHPISQKNAPWTEHPAVIPAHIRMKNPLNTNNADYMRSKVIPALEDAFKKDRSRTKEFGADMWDKDTRYTPKEWVAQLKEDLAKGDNSFVWTSIPDKVTAQLRALGHDGILDRGGKQGGDGHNVAIPFNPQDVRSVNAAFDPAKTDKPGLLYGIAAALGIGGGSAAMNGDMGGSDYRRDYANGGRVNKALAIASKLVDRKPTDAQKESGNYAKGHAKVHGLDVTIENPKGSERSGMGKDGKRWSVKMPAIYGYVKGTEGFDGDHVDVYIGPDHDSKKVFVVDQINAEDGKFDEHKCLLSYPTKEAALADYCKAFSDGKADQRIGAVTEMTIDRFKSWVKSAGTQVPLGDIRKKYANGGAVIADEDLLSDYK